MPIFGYNVIGTLGFQDLDNRITGSLFTCPEPGEAQSITAYMGGDIQPRKCAIYKHSDLSLVGFTEQRVVGAGWQTFNFSAPKPILAAEDYILVAWGDRTEVNVPVMAYDDGNGPDPGNQGHFQALAYDGFPDPLVPTHEDRKYSIYCTYDLIVGWTGTISGVVNPGAIAGVDVADIASVKGVA